MERSSRKKRNKCPQGRSEAELCRLLPLTAVERSGTRKPKNLPTRFSEEPNFLTVALAICRRSGASAASTSLGPIGDAFVRRPTGTSYPTRPQDIPRRAGVCGVSISPRTADHGCRSFRWKTFPTRARRPCPTACCAGESGADTLTAWAFEWAGGILEYDRRHAAAIGPSGSSGRSCRRPG